MFGTRTSRQSIKAMAHHHCRPPNTLHMTRQFFLESVPLSAKRIDFRADRLVHRVFRPARKMIGPR